MRKILTTLLLLNCLIGFGQIEKDSVQKLLSKNIDILITEAKKGNPFYYDKELITPISNYPALAYNLFKKFENDDDQNVIHAVVSNYQWLRGITDSTKLRENLTYDLLQLYRQHKQPLNSYNTYSTPQILSDPKDSKSSDFNTESKQLLVELLQDSLISRRILKVIGIAGMQDQIPELKKFLPGGERYRKDKVADFYFSSWEWYARLAMARLGDQEQIKFCVEKIESSEEEIMSNSYAAGNYFDDLIYIKQPEVLPFLFEMLIANKEFPGDPIYTTAYYVANSLYKLLEKFPHNPDVIKYSDKSIKNFKKWIRENKGKYEFKD